MREVVAHMAWLQCAVEVDPSDVDAVEDRLLAAGAHSVTLEDAGDEPILEPEPGTVPLWNVVRVVALFDSMADRDAIAAALQCESGLAEKPRFENLADREWSRAWLDHWHPLRFGERLQVVPDGHPLPDEDGVVLRLDPGLAFGTGTHPTTALCLEWLDMVNPHGRMILDYGCGSGILAIAGVLLGAVSADAVDIDPQALEATRANADKNGVTALIRTHEVQPFLELPGRGAFDIVLANILAGPLIDAVDVLAERQPSGGRLALAGLLERQADDVTAAFAPHYKITIGAEREGWVLLDGLRH